MKADDAKELRRLKDENGRLKRMVADQALDIQMLKEVARDALIDVKGPIAQNRPGEPQILRGPDIA